MSNSVHIQFKLTAFLYAKNDLAELEAKLEAKRISVNMLHEELIDLLITDTRLESGELYRVRANYENWLVGFTELPNSINAQLRLQKDHKDINTI